MSDTVSERHILTFCSECGRPFIIHRAQWIAHENNQGQSFVSKFHQHNSLSRPMRVTLSRQEDALTSIYARTYEYASSKFNFPICQRCLESLIQRIKYVQNFTHASLRAYGDLQTEGTFKALESSYSAMKNVFPQSCPSVSPDHHRIHRSITYTSAFGGNGIQHDPTIPRQISASQMMSVASLFIFRIGSWRQFGTVNGQRLGLDKSGHVSFREFETSLFLLCDLIRFTCGLVGLDRDRIEVSSTITVRHGDSSISLNAGDIRKMRGLQRFNDALHLVMVLCADIFRQNTLTASNLIPPFTISLSQRSIGNSKYEVTRGDNSEFNSAMKYLLFDMKCIQTRSLRNAVIDGHG